MLNDQKYIDKAKGLFDNIEIFLSGKTRSVKELYYYVNCREDAKSTERYVDFYMGDLAHYTGAELRAISVFRIIGNIFSGGVRCISEECKAIAISVLDSVVCHYPSLDIKEERGRACYHILVSFSSLDKIDINLSFANEDLPVSKRRCIIVVPDDGQPKYASAPTYTITKALELFKFPPNHPSVNAAYAMVDVSPYYYVPLAGFHEHYKQTKHTAFIELCASLGAKEICIENAEINEKTLDVNADIEIPITKLDLGIKFQKNHETEQKIAYKFSEANRHIKDFDSLWLDTEPSWMSMNQMRRNNHLVELCAEFTCLDDMGINANLSTKLHGVGINIGGNFNELTKIRLNYRVIFWE